MTPEPIISRSKSATIVKTRKAVQVVFWERNASADLSAQDKLRVSEPCVIVATAIAAGWRLHVADPSKALTELTIQVERRGAGPCLWHVPLPNGSSAGSTVAA